MESELGILVIRGIDLLRWPKVAANQDSEGCRGSSSTSRRGGAPRTGPQWAPVKPTRLDEGSLQAASSWLQGLWLTKRR
jgi:hypothetical protein